MKTRIKLGEVIDTRKGFAFKSSWFSETGSISVVKVTNFTTNSVDSSNLVKIPAKIADKYQAYRLNAGDVVVQTVGSWASNPNSVVGKCIRIPHAAEGALLNQNAVIIKPRNQLTQTYLFYLLRTEGFKGYIVGTAQGAASQAAITLDSLKSFEFELPSIEHQTKIASILGPYDELIENNSRRIEALESMALQIYKRTVAQLNESNSMKMLLEDVSKTMRGISWERANESTDTNKAIKVLTIPNVQKHVSFEGATLIKDVDQKKLELNLLKRNDILMVGSNGNPERVGAVARVGSEEPALFASFLMRIQADENKVSPYILYLMLKDNNVISSLRSGAIGAVTLRNIRISQLRSLLITIPHDHIQEAASKELEPIYSLIDILLMKNLTLSRARDLLISNLMQGNTEI